MSSAEVEDGKLCGQLHAPPTEFGCSAEVEDGEARCSAVEATVVSCTRHLLRVGNEEEDGEARCSSVEAAEVSCEG